MTTTGYSRSPKLLKGALIYFGAPMLIPIPNIIVFQYNPESMTRTLTPFQPSPQVTAEGRVTNQSGQGKGVSLSQPCDPQESFSLTLELDATDALEHPESHPLAMVSGIADRLAAIEMLMYPPEEGGGLLGGMASISVSAGGLSLGGGAGGADTTPKRVPIVLFFWGPGRIVPVRVTTLSIEEQQYSPTLYPLRAKANIGLNVLTLEELKALEGDPSSEAALEIAKGCYSFTRTQKKVLATANLANSAESIIGMLPI
jgi:hypothetical protein